MHETDNLNFTPLALEILKDRYLHRDTEGNITETPKQMLRRVADAIAPDPETADLYYRTMANLDFLPNSPTLMNAGRPYPHGQLAACFVIGIEDTMPSICEALRKQMLIHKTGGGTGFNFSKLRPKNSTVNSTNGRASGPVSFMRLFDLSTEVIQQGGMRRGANMAILNADHPDIREFISCKDEEGKITNFNLSVGISDDFMKKVVSDHHSPEAALLYDIAKHAWKSGDPGVIFLDTINKDNHRPDLGTLDSTNPCVTGDTPILTDNGYTRIEECAGKTVNVWNGKEFSLVTPRITGNNNEIMTIHFSDGSELRCTLYHKFHIQPKYTRIKSFVLEAKDLKIGDKLVKTEYPVIIGGKDSITTEQAYLNGFFTGDGTETAAGRKQLRLYGEKKTLLDVFKAYGSVGDITRNPINIELTKTEGLYNKYWLPSKEGILNRVAWLAGLIDADGHRNSKEGSVVITSIHRDFLLNIRLMLNTLGIPSHVLPLKEECIKEMPDGKNGKQKYHCQKSYRLSISAANIIKLQRLGMETKRVNLTNITPNRDAGRFVRVVKIKRTGEIADKVYCFNEPLNHTGIFNGLLTGNCGESPLFPNEACNLGSINLANFYDPTAPMGIAWSRLGKTVTTATQMLDDIIDISHYPLPEIQAAVKKTRKIGLGVMGFADLLYLLRIPYNTSEACQTAEKIMSFIKGMARIAASIQAAAKGHTINETVTCVAPTGTLALLANCSSGIEPIFSLSHTRTITKGDGTKIDIQIFNPAYEQLLRDNTVTDEELKKICVTAYDIDYEDHIRMQARFQEHTDLAVSKTINMKNTATPDDIYNAYIMAWTQGCKGITVYRDGSRASQVLTMHKDALPEVKCSTC